MVSDQRPSLEEHVLAWLKDRKPSAVEVNSVVSYGTDWAGDTEGGFYPESDVTIRWTDDKGIRQSLEIRGEDMADLWDHVVSGWSS